MTEGDGVNELVDGVARVAATGLGTVAENTARRREAETRAQAEAARLAAAGDRAAAAGLRGPDRAAGEAGGLSVREQARREVRLAHRETGDTGVSPEELARVRGARADAVTATAVVGADARRQAAGLPPLDTETRLAHDVAARSFAQAAEAAVRSKEGAGKARPAAARRARGPQRERGR